MKENFTFFFYYFTKFIVQGEVYGAYASFRLKVAATLGGNESKREVRYTYSTCSIAVARRKSHPTSIWTRH